MAKVGRPPKLFTDEKALELAEDLIEWLDDPQGGKYEIHYVRWYFHKHGMFRDDWKKLIERQIFRPYYEVARQVMASNLVKNDTVFQSYGGRYLAMHDFEVRELEKEIEKEKAELKARDATSFINFAENLSKMQEFFGRVQLMQLQGSTSFSVNHSELQSSSQLAH